jgi:hypothetical protein
MSNEKSKKNVETILKILKDEIEGRVQGALKKMDENYSMTWVYKRRDGVLFPAEFFDSIKNELDDIYAIKGREYKIKHIIGQGDVVMAELVESYPDPKKIGVVYRTPMVIVWEFKNGKIKTGRHYCDPQLSYENLSKEDVKKIYK